MVVMTDGQYSQPTQIFCTVIMAVELYLGGVSNEIF